jgi:hypothetical protein
MEYSTYMHNNYSHNPVRETLIIQYQLKTNDNSNMTFVPVENAFKDAVLSEARSNEINGQLLT